MAEIDADIGTVRLLEALVAVECLRPAGGRFIRPRRLWGFTGPPGQMTAAGRGLFLHTCRYAASLDEKGGDVKKR